MTDAYDKERLSAYVDGEMSPEERARIERHLEGHPEDRAYVARLRGADEALRHAFEPSTPPSAGLADLLGLDEAPAAPAEMPGAGENVVAFPPRRRRPALVLGGLAVAASAVLALVLVPGLLDGPGVPDDPSRHLAAGALPPGSAYGVVLDEAPSGSSETLPGGADLTMVASFADAQGRFCREFFVLPGSSKTFDHAIACNTEGGWTVEVVASQDAVIDEQGFRPASGPGERAVEEMLDALGAGLALSAEEERAAIAAGWISP